MRDVNNGWIIRYTHANVASFFFIFVYMHIGRGLYYSSYKSPRILVWSIGVVILILMMAIAFLGYVDNSPKWFYISIPYLIILIVVYITVWKKNKILITPPPNFESFGGRANDEYNKLNYKSIYLINSLNNRGYSRLCLSQLKKEISLPLRGSLPSLAPTLASEGKETPPSPPSPPSRGGRVATQGRGGVSFGRGGRSDRLNTIITELGLNTVYIYENLETENIKKQILNETKGLSGIYMILNKITKDYYIGSASTNRFYARFSNHVIYFRGSKIVKSAIKKYELKNFAFIILELYPNIVTKVNNKELLDLEDKYLKLLLPNYNILTEAGSSFGYKHTEIDRIKMKDLYSEARRVRIGNLNRGKIFSQETIEKMRVIALNRPPMSDMTKQKCISHTRPVVLYNLNGTVYGKYSSILEAAKSINCGEKTIRRALKTEKRLVKKQWIVEDFLK